MIDLLQQYSIQQIIIFIIFVALAIKGVISFIDWVKEKNKAAASQMNKPIQLAHHVDKNEQKIQELQQDMKIIIDKVNTLIESDKDDIKAYINQQHHSFCYEKGWIDDYSLDCLQRRYAHYKKEGGNTFIDQFMKEIRALPRQQTHYKETV